MNSYNKANTDSTLFHQLIGDVTSGFLWFPILFGVGIWLYFALPVEIDALAIVALIISIAVIFTIARRSITISVLLLAILIVLAGFLVALYRAHMVAAPVLPINGNSYQVTGWVEKAKSAKRQKIRYIVRVKHLDKISDTNLPYRISVLLPNQGQKFGYGDFICFRAFLRAPPGPVQPHGFDYARQLWFQSIGGTGYSLSKAELCSPSFATRHSEKLNDISNQKTSDYDYGSSFLKFIWFMREQIKLRLSLHLDDRMGAIAKAIMIGERGGIKAETLQALRYSGLGHLLAISGLHMVFFAGSAFLILRSIFAFFPYFALQFPLKKGAALVAFCCGGFYLFISGGAISTQRAFVILALILIAIMLERPALTMRNIAIAAIIILILQPESLLTPSFQMSFAAVIALVGAYRTKTVSKILRFMQRTIKFKPLLYLASIMATTLIASLATAPFAIYHFNYMAYAGVIANIIAIPVFSFLIMPMALLAIMLMPFGLEVFPLKFMGSGIEILLYIAEWFSSLNHAALLFPAMSSQSLGFIIIGGLMLLLVTNLKRFFGFAFFILAILNVKPSMVPDILIDGEGKVFAIRNEKGLLQAPEGRRGEFALSQWMKRDGDHRGTKEARQGKNIVCDQSACRAWLHKSKNSKRFTLSYITHMAAVEEDCSQSDVIISMVDIYKKCHKPTVIIRKRDLLKHGAHSLSINDGHIELVRADYFRRNRLWGRGAR